MNLQNDCKECLYKQINRYLHSRSDRLDNAIANKILEEVAKALKKEDFNIPPPQVAIMVYEILRNELKASDPYKEIKEYCLRLARDISKSLQIENLNLQKALKIAVIGNAIDYGSQSNEKIEVAITNTINQDWSINCASEFEHKLHSTKTLLYIADNAGENYFDEVLIRFIKENFNIKITYLVRGTPIINDLVIEDITQHKSLFELCEVKSSGVKSAGFIYDLANKDSKKLFDSSDLILAKGMGNYECLETIKDKRIFLLFKIKCKVVEDFLKKPIDSLVFMQNI